MASRGLQYNAFIAVAAAFLTSAAAPILAEAGWTSRGPHGGAVWQVAVDPLSTTVYVVSGGTIYKTTGSGRSWTVLAAQPDSSGAYWLAVDPTQAGHLISGNASGIAWTTDGGSTWSQVAAGNQIFRLSFDPSRPNVAYALSASSVLYRSLDDGASWGALGPPMETGQYISDFAVSGGGTLFVALSSVSYHSGLVLLRSADEGENWSSRVFPDATSYLFSLVADSVASETVYAVTSNGLFRSADGGNSWSRRGGGVASCLAIDPHDPATLYAGSSATFYPPSNGGVWKSTNTGVTWKMLAAPFPPLASISSLAVSPANSTLWAGTGGDGVFRSLDAGTSWSEIGGIFPGISVTSIAVDPTTFGTVYAGSGSRSTSGLLARVYRSDDAGGGWAPVLAEHGDPGYPGSGPDFTALAVDPISPKTIYATVKSCFDPHPVCGGGILKTTDGGFSWSALDLTGPTTAIVIDPADPKTLYASFYNPLWPFLDNGSGYKSTDGGSSWTLLDGGFPTAEVRQWLIDPSPPATLYVATCDTGVFASKDGGATWTARNQGLTDLCLTSLARGSTTSGALYAGTRSGIFQSVNRGMSWNLAGFSRDATALTVDPHSPTILFAGTSQSGVFRSLDGGGTWNDFSEGLTNLEVRALAIDSAGAFLHAATAGGVFDFQLRRIARVVRFR